MTLHPLRRSGSTGVAAGVTLGIVLLTAAACSPASSPGPSATPVPTASPSSTPPGDAAVPLIRVTAEGGFINPAATLANLPLVVVLADGRIFTPGDPSPDNLNPLVPSVAVRSVGAAGTAAILAAIRDAGLDREAAGSPGIPGDSGVDVFSVTIDGTTVTNRFAGNGPGGPGGPGMPGGGGDDPARQAALDLLGRLLDPAEGWGGASDPVAAFAPVADRIYVAPDGPVDGSASPPPVTWPLATALADFGTPASSNLGIDGLRSGIASGDDLATLEPILDAATSDTVFSSGGQAYTLYVRPLLPDELGG
jgi:hypothetical protein